MDQARTRFGLVALAWLLPAAVSVICAPGNVGPGEILVYQSDFDENIDPGFAVDPYKQGAKLTSEERRSGVYSLSCRGNKEYYQYFGRIAKLPIQSGRSYRLSVWSKLAGKPLVVVHVFFLKKGKMTNPPRSIGLKIPGSKEWRRNELVFTVPAEFDGGELRFRFCTTSPEVVGYFDDLSLVMMPPGLKVDYQCRSRDQVVSVELNVADFLSRESLSRMRAAVEFRHKGSGTVAAHRDVTGLKSMVSKIECPIRDLPTGQYDIVVTLKTRNGQALDTRRVDFSVFRKPGWEGNRLGILPPNADAPPPWSNLRVKGSTVECWGRRYRLGPTGLPEQIAVLDQEILARPVTLDLEVDGQPLRKPALELAVNSNQVATFESRAEAGTAIIEARTEIEFDGMLKYTIRITPKKGPGATITRLVLHIPLVPGHARLLQRVLTNVAWEGGLTADLTTGRKWSLREFCPHIWFGTEDRGIAWFAESDQGWSVGKSPRFQIIRTDGALSLRINMLTVPSPLEGPRDYVFGLQATPTRPEWPRWKDIRFRTKSVKPNTNVLWSNARFDKYYGFPLAADKPGPFKNLLASVKYPLRLIYLKNCYEGVPEFKFYEDRWRTEGTVYSVKAAGFDKRHFPIDHTDPLWQDFIVHSIYQWLRRWNITGMYHDCFGPCRKNGALQIFAFRELAKRVYIMHRQLYPEALTIVFAQPYVPFISFSDAILSGEMYRHALAKHGYYTAFMDLATFRAENVVKLGPARMILPQYKIAYQKSAEHAVHAMGMFLLHDLTVYASWMNMDVYDDIETRCIRFGRRGSTFHPYWKPGGRVAASPGLKVSTYERKNGLMAVVVNITDTDISDRIEVDIRGLKLNRAPVVSTYDPLTKQETKGRLELDGTLPVRIKRYSMALLTVE